MVKSGMVDASALPTIDLLNPLHHWFKPELPNLLPGPNSPDALAAEPPNISKPRGTS